MNTTPEITKPIDSANPKHYLSKAEMHMALVSYKEECDAAKAAGLELPGVSNYLGACFLNIARGIGHKHNFRNYSFLNEMISDGVLTCLKYVGSYDPGRRNIDTGLATSPLAYFSQAISFAFIGRITKEAKQSKIKRALIYSADIDSFSTQDEDAGEFHINLTEFINGLGKDDVAEIISNKKEKPNVPGGLEDFM
jgi:hypothetical protein